MNPFNFKLPELYARAKTGNILTWNIEVEGNKHRTITGTQDGKKVVSKWTITKPKNEGNPNATTAEQQAEFEATAKWKNKIKREGYWEDIKDIDKTPLFIEPMLAQKLRDHSDKVKFPCMVDRKYNGGRIVASVTGLFSRKGERYMSIPHIEESLAPLFEKYPDLVLDGEGYNHDLRFKLNDLMKILRTTKESKLTPELLSHSEKIVRFYVYDGYGFNNITEQTGNINRRNALKSLIKGIPYLVWVPYEIANTIEEVYSIYQSYVEDGMEGAIIRNNNAPYEHARSYNLLKVKPTDDSEGSIIKIIEGIGNASGLAAKATLNWNGPDGLVEFEATFMGDVKTRQNILHFPDNWVGREVTFLYNGLTGKTPRKPNYARIDPDNCFQGKK